MFEAFLLGENLKRELIIFIGLFLFLAIGMHFSEWLSHPIEHLMNIQHGGAFGVPGYIHPFVFTLVVYILVWIPRGIVKLFSKKTEQ